MMFKRLIKKSSDFFFEDVEEDIEEREIPADEKAHQARQINQKNKDIKMKYQYSKTPEFRFPVIPDTSEQAYEKRKSPIQPDTSHKQKRNTYQKYQATTDDDLIYGYNKQKMLKEMEDIPAFMRIPDSEHRIQEIKQSKPEKKIEKKQVVKYSNPDELDRVFRKKDAVRPQPITPLDTEKSAPDLLEKEVNKIEAVSPREQATEKQPDIEQIKPKITEQKFVPQSPTGNRDLDKTGPASNRVIPKKIIQAERMVPKIKADYQSVARPDYRIKQNQIDDLVKTLHQSKGKKKPK